MSWIKEIFFTTSIVQSILVIALTVSVGMYLGKFKFKGISLGIAWILFAGIFFSHLGMLLNDEVAHFVKEFGLILFVYSIGLQVGPGFFSSLRRGGFSLNMLALGIVFTGCLVTYIIHLVSGESLSTMVGVLSGAVTNTPSLGATQQTFVDMTHEDPSSIALGYAVTYPLGVIGIIFSMMLLRGIFKKKLAQNQSLNDAEEGASSVVHIDVKVINPSIDGRSVQQVIELINREFIVSRITKEDATSFVAQSDTIVCLGDVLRIVTKTDNSDAIVAFVGELVAVGAKSEKDSKSKAGLVIRKIVVTKEYINGKVVGQLNLQDRYGVSITRINRAGVVLIAVSNLRLQLGDRVTVVGKEADIAKAADMLGDSMKRLDHPNLFPIFFGILLGVVVGLIPIYVPGMPQAIKLGLAGGPLIVAILISRFGPYYKMITFTTTSANMMLREVGISLFLASVGLGAGEKFIDTIVNGGYWWVLYGVLITLIPLIVVGIIGIHFCRLNANTLMGLLAGSTTDPPALAYANSQCVDDRASVAYATVYPLTMFLRVIAAQIMILMALS